MHKIFFYNKCIIRFYVFRTLCACSVCGIGTGLPPKSTMTTTEGKGTNSYQLGSNAATNQIVI